ASAYGVAVTGTFMLTTILFFSIVRLRWHRPWRVVLPGAAVFLTIEVAFFTANLTKIVSGGWLPLAIALVIFTVLVTWRRGREIVTANRRAAEGPLRDFIEHLDSPGLTVREVPGVAVFLSPNLTTTPLALRANVEHNHVLHDEVLIVSVRMERVPHIHDSERVVPAEKILDSAATGDPLGRSAEKISALTLRFGFRDRTDVPGALRLAAERGLIRGGPELEGATYFLSQITIVPDREPGLASWRKKLFVAMARNAASPVEYFRLPDNQTVTTSGRIPV
ncbi:MAG: KUP/HAK/KT family potassium transporter, partial [Acidobacteriota bacterium]|nr:KUP/HAK/KT family potassium transporter [Acidobacteriota bacterium]